MHTTYTLLVTIAHEGGAALSTELLEVMVQRGLEEGVREMAGVAAASVSALQGDLVEPCAPGSVGATRADRGGRMGAKRLHAELRA
jgi:hypothetical protein